MLQISNLAVLLKFFLLFSFLVLTECQVLNLMVGRSHVTRSCKGPIKENKQIYSNLGKNKIVDKNGHTVNTPCNNNLVPV